MTTPEPTASRSDSFDAIRPFGGDRTVERTITRELRNLITQGKLEPGLRLRYRDVAKQFGVSVTPVRIALHDLAKEGLVELIPHGGAHVAGLSLGELEELYATRAGVEGLIAHLSAKNVTPEALAAMKASVAELEQLALGSAREQYLALNWDYKVKLYALAERPELLESVTLYAERSTRYSTLALGEDYRFQESLSFQRQLVDACERRDGWAAERVLREAMDWTREYLSKVVVATDLGTSKDSSDRA